VNGESKMTIDDLNQEIKGCHKCRLSETRINAICGEGNQNAKLMLIAQAPGENEDREGKMFIGPSGKVLDELLRASGVKREEIYMTNLIKCMLPKYRKPKQDEIEICSEYLLKEMEIINPDILIPLGYYATRYIFENCAIPLPPRPEFYTVYGRLVLTDDRKIFPLRHPAAALYHPSVEEEMLENYRRMRFFLTDCKWYPVCPMKRYYEEGRLDKRWIELYCRGDWGNCVRYRMEESGEPHPDWMLPDGSVDERLREGGL